MGNFDKGKRGKRKSAYHQRRTKRMTEFERRKQRNARVVRKNNANLPAGAPMFYYCKLCGAEMIEPETHSYPAPRLCDECIHEDRVEP